MHGFNEVKWYLASRYFGVLWNNMILLTLFCMHENTFGYCYIVHTVKYHGYVDHVVRNLVFCQVYSRKFNKIWCSKGHGAP
jgi:hypothetical protein